MMLPRTILVGTDFSEHADHALEYAARLAAQLDATLHIVHALAYPAGAGPEMTLAIGEAAIAAMRNAADAALETRVNRYRDRVTLGPPRLEVGDPRDVIARTAEQIDADLIIVGTHGRRGLRRLLLGSVAETVVRTAPCPVLTIRPKKKPA